MAFGACATTGGVNALKNFQPLEKVRKYVYGGKWETYDTVPTMSVDKVVKVDYYIHGCPVSKSEILHVVTSLLVGKEPQIPDYPVCVECKLAENPCVFDKGLYCMGPVTRAGCNALCPTLRQQVHRLPRPHQRPQRERPEGPARRERSHRGRGPERVPHV